MNNNECFRKGVRKAFRKEPFAKAAAACRALAIGFAKDFADGIVTVTWLGYVGRIFFIYIYIFIYMYIYTYIFVYVYTYTIFIFFYIYMII